MLNKFYDKIFQKGSKTYYNSSKFFSKEILEDIEILYAFVRTADDYVDSIPQNKKMFIKFKNKYYSMLKKEDSNKKKSISKNSDEKIIESFIELSRRKKFDKKYAEAFLNAMESDLYKKKYYTLKELEEYMYGSAGVIGLFMNRILDIPKKADIYALILGKSMQYINFIRDIKEDFELGRTYMPINDTIKISGNNKQSDIMKLDTKLFDKLIRNHIDIYESWRREAEYGFRFIDKKKLVPIKTASEMYHWTAKKIYSNPQIILRKKVKPSKLRIIITALKNKMTI